MSRKNFRKLLYETFVENKNLPKTEIVKIAARKAEVTEARIWHELDKRRLTAEENIEIIEALKYKSDKKEENIEQPETQKNIETIVETEQLKTLDSNKIIKKHKKPSKEELEDLYITKKLDTNRIARKYQRRRSTIYRWLREYEISRHIVSIKRPRNLGRPLKEELYREYVEEKKGIGELAKKYSAGGNTVRRWLKGYGIRLRSASEERLKNKKLPTKEELEEFYVNKQMSIKKIAKMYNVSKRVIKRLLNNSSFQIRSYEEALSLAALKGKRVPSKEELINLYFEKEKSIDEIAKAYDISHLPILRLFKKYNLKTRTLKQAARLRIKKKQQAALEKFEEEKYKGLKGLIGLFGQAAEDEEAKETIDGITSSYLYKLRNLYETLGEENVEDEILLIAKHDKNKLEPLLLKCLYVAVLKTEINPTEIHEGSGEFEVLQRGFFSEIRKLYIKYAIENKENRNNGRNCSQDLDKGRYS